MTNSDIKISKPKILNKTIYKSDSLVARHLLDWEEVSILPDDKTGMWLVWRNQDSRNFLPISWNDAVVLDSSEVCDCCSPTPYMRSWRKSIFAYPDGKLATDFVFDHISFFSEGLSCVGIEGLGYGFINAAMEMVIPCQYHYARSFKNGYAVVSRIENGKVVSGCVDKQGTFTAFRQKDGTPYASIDDCEEGLFMVSSKAVCDLAHLLLKDMNAINPVGVFGFVNAQGEEVIPSQYLSVINRPIWENGVALVCKGHWSQDPKTANEAHSFWPDSILWGGIDKTGKVVTPYIFDEIRTLCDDDGSTNTYAAHFGGWKNGKWGLIDCKGKWIVEPQFDGMPQEMEYGLLTFQLGGIAPDSDELGIYDMDNQKVIFEPQFKKISLCKSGAIFAEIYNYGLRQTIEKVFNRKGEEVICDEAQEKHGLVDETSQAIFHRKYDTPYNTILSDLQRIIFQDQDGDKYGVMDFQENIIIPAKYTEITHIEKDIWEVTLGKRWTEKKRGIISENGNIVIPIAFDRIFYSDKYSSDARYIAFEKMLNNSKDIIIANNESGTSIFELEMLSKGNRQEDMKP